MYSTCLFCKRPLGSNEVVETFPVGRRLAFDAARGRLWVVCRKCRRWNLTPLEERWEAVETCERLFRATPLRASTDQIGLARHREGLELVRIGRPPRGEFAAWRYGDQFRKRMRKWQLALVGSVAAGLAFVNLPGAIASGSAWVLLFVTATRPVAKVGIGGAEAGGGPVGPGTVVKFTERNVRSIRMLPADDETGFTVDIRRGMSPFHEAPRASFMGEDARKVAAAVLPVVNANGGTRRAVQDAVAEIEVQGHPGRYVARAVRGNPDVDRESPPGFVTNHAQAHATGAGNGLARGAGTAGAGGRALDAETGMARSGRDRGDRGPTPAPGRDRRLLREVRNPAGIQVECA
ncbi:hypothetical protein [Candidatus Palauibacter sp.]|uniref:hypothetical protein n=1 Tax=Candidatus Palauibacter sp. TaxID=3101350 RepID=UPI003B526F66